MRPDKEFAISGLKAAVQYGCVCDIVNLVQVQTYPISVAYLMGSTVEF
jgi:hypothetical protein